MSVDRDIESFSQGLDELFKPKPIAEQPEQVIRHEEQKTPWQKKRTWRTQTDVYSMVCCYVHHEGDRQWLVSQLQTLPLAKREAAMMEYAQIYERTRDCELNQNIRDGQARRAANSWLVELMEKLTR